MKKILFIFLLFSCLADSKEINLICKGKSTITINPIGESIEKIQVSSKSFTETISIFNNILIKPSNSLKVKKYHCLVTSDGIVCPTESAEKRDERILGAMQLKKDLEIAALESNAKVPNFPEYMDDSFILIIDRYSGVMTNIQSYAEFSKNGKRTIYANDKEGICEPAKPKF